MRFVCELGDAEHLIEADTPEQAAHAAARAQASGVAAGAGGRQTYIVTVAEANEADLPLIAGEDYSVTVEIPPVSE